MNEQTAWAELPDVADVIRTMSWSDSTYMYLEKVPQAWLDDAARQSGIQLQRYAADTTFDAWQRGRVFDTRQELKWEYCQQRFHVVYCGHQPPEGWTLAPLHAVRQQVQTYYLWGSRVQDTDRAHLGLAPDTPAFVELQIPRILQYPILTQGARVQVRVYEFYAADGQLCYARWSGLEEVER